MAAPKGRRPVAREEAITTISRAMGMLTDEATVVLLPGYFLRGLLEADLPRAVALVGKYNRVRHDQSYSRQRAAKTA
jgi:hypothetical protein